MKKRGFCAREKLLVLFILLLGFLFMVFGCYDPSGSRGAYSLDDEELLPFAAMYEIDREQFCLTEIDRNSKVEIQRDYGGSSGYEAMLHLYSDGESRTIAFARENDQYIWIGEQKVHYSGQKFTTVDGEVRENITISYYKRKISGGVVGLSITYLGDSEEIPSVPTCEQASQYIKEWDTRSETSDSK
jgi:hypothetical protein